MNKVQMWSPQCTYIINCQHALYYYNVICKRILCTLSPCYLYPDLPFYISAKVCRHLTVPGLLLKLHLCITTHVVHCGCCSFWNFFGKKITPQLFLIIWHHFYSIDSQVILKVHLVSGELLVLFRAQFPHRTNIVKDLLFFHQSILMLSH